MTNKKVIQTFFDLINGEFNFYKNSKRYDKILKQIYKDMKKIKPKKIVINKVPYQEKTLSKSHFVSDNAKKALSKIKYTYQSNFTISGVDITLDFIMTNNNKNEYLKNAEKVQRLLNFMINLSNLKMKTLNIILFLHDDKKVINKKYEILSPKHVNTAVTYACNPNGEIFLYRKEEWFKVLIHELMHSLCLDFSGIDIKSLQDNIKKIFNINSEFEISETYSEFWATIINCCFLSLDISRSYKTFKQNVTMMVDFERIFSLFQSTKILKYMKIDNYKTFLNEQSHLFEEKTNVFSYYILKSILLYHYDDFMTLCYENNQPSNPIFFYKSPANLNDLFHFILNNYNNDEFVDDYMKMSELFKKVRNNTLLHTMRMTLFEKK
tara:strand:- start:476 stop:1615 length:1140 start_codon:yes stop_codon:yes gene_type:complete